jgi:hypothetical protein
MPDGKPAGVRCINLLDDYKCAIYNDAVKPKVCTDFKAETEFCGSNKEEAMRILYSLGGESSYPLAKLSYFPELYTTLPPVIV